MCILHCEHEVFCLEVLCSMYNFSLIHSCFISVHINEVLSGLLLLLGFLFVCLFVVVLFCLFFTPL